MNEYLLIGFDNHPESKKWNFLNNNNIKDFNIIIFNLDSPSISLVNEKSFDELPNDLITLLNSGKSIIFTFNSLKTIQLKKEGFYRKILSIFPILANFKSEIPIYNKKIKNERFKNYFGLINKVFWNIEVASTLDSHLVENFWENQNLFVNTYYNPIAYDNCGRIIALELFYRVVSIDSFNKITKIVKKSGSLTFLPSLELVDEIEGINSLLVDVFKIKQIEEEPLWIKSLLVPGEEKIKRKISKLNKGKEEVNKKIKEEENKIDYLSQIKRTLYSTGNELEDAVGKLLLDLGLNIEKNKISEEDLLIKEKECYLVIEVKGIEGAFDKKGVRQLENWVSDFQENNLVAKGILIGNYFRKKPLNERRDPFAPKIIEYAERNKLLLITTDVLFNIYCKIKEGKLNTVDFLKILKNEIGVYNFRGK